MDLVMQGARHIVAMQIAHDPVVRSCVRQTFYECAKINVRPTKKGLKVYLFQGNLLVFAFLFWFVYDDLLCMIHVSFIFDL